MKKRPTGKTNKSALDALTSMAIIVANNPTVQKTMPVLALALGYVAGARKLRTTQGGVVSFDAYQLCESCAQNFLANKWHLLPNVCKDIQQSDLLAFDGHAGGMQ